MAATRLIAMHVQKNRSVQQCLKDRTDYAENGEKTENGEYISSYECDPETVDQEFAFSKSRYGQLTGRSRDDDIITYQIRQSFKPGEVTPEEANRIGYETAMRWTKGNHAFIVATHVDKAHIHNHVIYNSTTLDCFHKFRNFLFCGIALQRVSDLVCLEHGCSVIKPRKPGEREKRTVYPNRKSIRDKIREDIDLAMSRNPKNMEELFKCLEEMGYEIKRAKHIGIKGEGQKTFLRFDSLGAGYREGDFEKVFKGEESFNPPPREKQSHRYEKPKKKFDMLLDIQDIIARGKDPGYERWAKVHNIKQISQTLIYLRDHDIRDMIKVGDDKNSLLVLERITNFTCFSAFLYLVNAHSAVYGGKRIPILIDAGKNLESIKKASEQCFAYAKTAVEDYFIESLNCILHTEIAHNSKDACLEWIKRMNFKSQTREEEITSAINSYFESFCEDEDEPIHALAHAIQIILYTFDYKNNSPSEFCRVLGTRCGLAGPRGNAAKKRYLINSFTLETITYSLLSDDDIEDGLELRELSKKALDAYCILLGADVDNEYRVLEEVNIAQSTPGDLRGDLALNAQKLADLYIALGLAHRYADGVTLIGRRQ